MFPVLQRLITLLEVLLFSWKTLLSLLKRQSFMTLFSLKAIGNIFPAVDFLFFQSFHSKISDVLIFPFFFLSFPYFDLCILCRLLIFLVF